MSNSDSTPLSSIAQIAKPNRNRTASAQRLVEFSDGALDLEQAETFLAWQELQGNSPEALAEEAEFARVLEREQDIEDRADYIRKDRAAHRRVDAEEYAPLEYVSIDDLTLTRTTWLIKGFVEQGKVGEIYGPFASAKSFLALDWAMSVASGSDWQGKPTAQQRVLYVAAEGGSGMASRKTAWVIDRKTEVHGDTFEFIIKPVNLSNELAVDDLCQHIRDHQIGFVIFDTLSRSIPGVEENNATAMGIVVEALFKMRDAWEADRTTVMVVHHSGKNLTLGGRGSNKIESDMDFVFRLVRSGERPQFVYTLANIKSKENQTQDDVAFSLKQVQVSRELELTSCVLEGADVEPEFNQYELKIIEALEGADGSLTQAELAEETGISTGGKNYIGVHLTSLMEKEKITKTGRKQPYGYRLEQGDDFFTSEEDQVK